MRILLPVAAAVLGTSFCCCGGGGGPTARLITSDCGLVTVQVSASAGSPRTITAERADQTRVSAELGWFETEAVLHIPMQDPGTLIIRDGDDTVALTVDDVEPITLAGSIDKDVPEGEVASLRVSADSGPTCVFPGSRVVAVAHPLKGGASTSAEQAIDGRSATLALGPLTQGAYAVDLALIDPRGQTLTTAQVPLVVLPPCVDEDGDGSMACSGDCDDSNPDIHPGARDTPGDGVDNDCDGINGTDRDADGFEDIRRGGNDCNDADPRVYPGAPNRDQDGDGYFAGESGADLDCDGQPDVPADRGGDCDDERASVHPSLSDEPVIGNGLDDDCDGVVDEKTNLFDDDGDGQTEEQGDCNDNDVRMWTGNTERYDCVDNNCDGTVDEGVDPITVDDAYEPNDSRDVRLSAARKVFLGWRGTNDEVAIVSRDPNDVETFSIVAHDGLLDAFDVMVEMIESGHGVRYEATIKGPHGTQRTGTLDHPGARLAFGGTVDHNDSGIYVISIQPSKSALEYCPARFRIISL